MKAILRPINVKMLNANMFHLLDDKWMLLTSGTQKKFNTMTASWGTFGILWNKPVAIGFVRPQRYTFDFINTNDIFTISFFPDEHKSALDYCGSHSGRDTDKITNAGLTPMFTEKGGIYFSQAHLVFECKKLYSDDLKSENFFNKKLIENIYPGADFHRFFIGEISNCYASEAFIPEKGTNFAASKEENTTDF